jgi:hypothetical protein
MIVLLTGLGGLSSLLFRNSAPAAAVLWGAVALLAGVGVTVGGIEAPSAALLLIGTALRRMTEIPAIDRGPTAASSSSS